MTRPTRPQSVRARTADAVMYDPLVDATPTGASTAVRGALNERAPAPTPTGEGRALEIGEDSP